MQLNVVNARPGVNGIVVGRDRMMQSFHFKHFFLNKYNATFKSFLFIFDSARSSLLRGLSLVGKSKGCSAVVVRGPLIAVASLVAERSREMPRLQELQPLGSSIQAQWLWCTDSVALWHVGSFQIRDGTHVSCIGRWLLYH